ncbi:uncharacterized protein DNG_03725 [Cephalotrichum gorgonifer]|uniref:GAR domain-containing protein n=1 Tax=Cephalotrichum gorgonifer TaxID=2041049 RepID=A0AAE8MWQ9_9PEZI|nr:uncharacterized protein DNG_03725 [Cephalotrichum gorgonifer]
MADPPSTASPFGVPHLRPPSRRQFSPQSSSRPRLSDELTTDLAPATAVDALRNPTDVLRSCLDGASPSEKAFVMRTAVASKTIHDWLEELSDWPWPTGGGSAGLWHSVAESHANVNNAGLPISIPISETAGYERRVEDIGLEMEQLNIEEIKAHVLHNHILPLSRPGTPMSDYSSRSLSYTRMEDITAVVTAIVVQALPNLSRLSRLLNVWTVRFDVLRHVTPFLTSVQDAEVALISASDAIAITATTEDTDPALPRSGGGGLTTLTRSDFQIMRAVLEKKVTSPGRILDYMLDSLETLEDTLPDEWLDRMEAVERGYGDWVVACDAKIREAEWAMAERERPRVQPKGKTGEGVEPKDSETRGNSRPEEDGEETMRPKVDEASASKLDRDLQARPASLTVQVDSPADSSRTDETAATTPNAESSEDELVGGASIHENRAYESIVGGVKVTRDGSSAGLSTPSPSISSASSSALEDGDEPQLPPLIGGPMAIAEDGSPQPYTPSVARPRYVELDDATALPTSSPPGPKVRTTSMSRHDGLGFLPIPSIEEDDEDSRPSTPFTDSFIEGLDDSPSVVGSPSKANRNHDQLQKQISSILESIPAKFTLESEPSSINLNPPDFKPPRGIPTASKYTKPDPSRRSRSGLSSRASTPGFTLAPAKNPRSRPKSTQQDIKVYHLSRATGEAPIKLFIRCVGESGERVMVRVGGGWADLGEYLKDYAIHHGRRSAGVNNDKIEVRDIPRVSRGPTSSPPSRPPSRSASALDSPMTPLNVRKTRRSFGADDSSRRPAVAPRTPLPTQEETPAAPPSNDSTRSRSSSRLSWGEDDSPMLGLAGPKSKPVEMSQENRAWVASVKEKVRLASGDLKASNNLRSTSTSTRAGTPVTRADTPEAREFGEMGKVGATKRLFRKG